MFYPKKCQNVFFDAAKLYNTKKSSKFGYLPVLYLRLIFNLEFATIPINDVPINQKQVILYHFYIIISHLLYKRDTFIHFHKIQYNKYLYICKNDITPMRKLFITISLIICCILDLKSQEFKFILEEQLSSKLISDIYQDRDGFIWISTDNGINRFDGNKVIAYNHIENDSLSLKHNLVYASFEDHKGNLYVGTYTGIQIFDKSRNCFSKYAIHSNGDDFSETVNGFCELPDGTICSYGDNAYKISVIDGNPIAEPVDWDIDTHSIFKIDCDNQNNVWAVKREDGLYKIRNGHSRKICDYNNPDFFIYDFHIVNGKIYIVTTGNDIYKYDSDLDKLFKLNKEPISKASIRYIFDYNNSSELLVCTDGNGFKLIDIYSGYVKDFYLNIPMLTSNHLKIHKVIKDQNKNWWISLYQKGAAVISASQNAFGYIGYKSLLNNIIGNSTASAICKDYSGNIWVGTDGDGIYKINNEATSSVHFHTYADGGTAPSIIKAICADSNGDIWFGTYGNGIGKISSNQNKYVSYENVFSRQGKATTRIYDIIEDYDKRLWVASLGAGIYCYDIEKGKLIEELSFNEEINKWQTSLLHTTNNLLYVGTFDGLYYINLSADTIRPIQISTRTVINSIYEDSKGQVWAGDNNGLMLVNTSGVVQYYNIEQGLPDVSINSINEGNDNTLWLASDKGLLNYSPITQKCVRFTTNDGLQNLGFSKNHSFKDGSGKIWFAGDYGITYFRPQDLEQSVNKRHVRIIDFLINNESITTESLSGDLPIVSEPVYHAKSFNLSQSNNSFSIEFGTYELDTPKFAVYKYSVNNDEWKTISPGSQRAYFNNLKSGTYNIRYKLVDNLVESDIQEIRVFVRPYWWASAWAIIAYSIFSFALILYFLRQIRYQYLTQKQHKRHQRVIEINEAKLQFFTNISHEIKTPLSLIISPLQKLMATDTDPKRQAAYSTMYRNSKMLSELINQLLDLRKIDNGKLKLNFRKAEINSIIEDLSSYFNIISEEKKISFSFVHDAQELFVWIDVQYFSKIIMNLLSNAFKYTPQGGRIVLSVRTIEKTDGKQYAEIEVKDNGIGIQEKDLQYIFDRFYIAENNKNNGSSNGIGLHLTRSLVNLHHGIIKAQNNSDGQGASFVVELPLGKEHFRDDETLLEGFEKTPAQVQSIDFNFETGNNDKIKSQSTKNLLIVDDDPEILNYLRKELSQDFHIDTCNNGKDALQMVFNKKPDLIISDVMMQEIDGITLCKKIKQNVNFNHIPIILLTAKSDETTNLQGLKYGADAFVAKPFYIEILRRTALNLVNLRSQLQNIYTGQQTQEERQVKIEMESPNQKLLDRIMKVVNNNLSNPELSIDMICEEVGISRAHIYRKLKELTNQSGRDFIKNIRLRYAENLLLEDSYSIGQIAEKVGFSKASNFSLAFKEKYGLSPHQWREAQKNK